MFGRTLLLLALVLGFLVGGVAFGDEPTETATGSVGIAPTAGPLPFIIPFILVVTAAVWLGIVYLVIDALVKPAVVVIAIMISIWLILKAFTLLITAMADSGKR